MVPVHRRSKSHPASYEERETTIIQDLTTGNPVKQLLLFAYPFILCNLLHQAYNLVDMLIVGHYVGTAGLAAISSTSELSYMYVFFGTGFSSAGQILIAQHIGAGNRDRIQDTIGTLFSFLLLIGVLMTVFSVMTCDTFLHIINVPEESFNYAHDGATVYFMGLVPVLGYNATCSILRGMGDSRRPLVIISIASVLNVILDLVFVGMLDMATFGAALATVLAQTCSFVVAIIYLYRNRKAFGFDFRLRSFAIKSKDLRPIISLGLPFSVQHVAFSVSVLYIGSYINACGVVAAAATAVGNKIAVVATVCTIALMTAGVSIIAQNFAAGKIGRVKSTVGYILLFCVAFCAFLSALLIIFPEQIFGAFDSNPQVIAMSHMYVPVGVVSFMGFATRNSIMSLINGIGNSRLSLIISVFDGIIVRIGLSLLMGITLEMGVSGFWWGNAIAGHAFGVVGAIYYFFGRWENRKPLT